MRHQYKTVSESSSNPNRFALIIRTPVPTDAMAIIIQLPGRSEVKWRDLGLRRSLPVFVRTQLIPCDR